MTVTIIRIREKDFRDNTFSLTVTFRGHEGAEKETDVQLGNPNDTDTEDLLAWYFEVYIGALHDDVKAAPACSASCSPATPTCRIAKPSGGSAPGTWCLK